MNALRGQGKLAAETLLHLLAEKPYLGFIPLPDCSRSGLIAQRPRQLAALNLLQGRKFDCGLNVTGLPGI